MNDRLDVAALQALMVDSTTVAVDLDPSTLDALKKLLPSVGDGLVDPTVVFERLGIDVGDQQGLMDIDQ